MDFLETIDWGKWIERLGYPTVFSLVLLYFISKAGKYIANYIVTPLVNDLRELIASLKTTNESNSKTLVKMPGMIVASQKAIGSKMESAIKQQTEELKACFSPHTELVSSSVPKRTSEPVVLVPATNNGQHKETQEKA